MRQIKTCMCFLFSQPIIWYPLLRRKFCAKYLHCAQKSVHYNKCVRYIEVFLRVFDRDLAGSLKKYPLLPGVCYVACPLWTGLTV